MIAGQAPSYWDSPGASDYGLGSVCSTALLDEPSALPHVEVPFSEVPGRGFEPIPDLAFEQSEGDPFGATAIACPPESPPPRLPRIRKAPDRIVSRIDIQLAAGGEIVGPAGNRSPWYLGAKRALDIAGALALLLVFSPIMLTTWLVLWFTTRGKPIFRQERLGSRGRPFTMYKFRTMQLDAIRRQGEVKNEKDGPIFKNRHDPRVTRLGRVLRPTSIDELPQLVNVLLGQMSLVGPRPPLAKEVAQYQPWQRRRLAVKPGLTCLWQVSGRSEIGFKPWVRMDLWYVRHQSLLTDLRLLAKTPWSVLSGRGAY